MSLLELTQGGTDDVRAEHAGVLEDPFLLEDRDGGDGRRAGQRMPRIREPTGVGALLERVGDGLADDDAAQRHVARVDALGEADEVGGHVPVVDGEPFAAAPEAGHDLVADHHDAVLVAQVPHALEVAGRRHQDAVGADDGLEHDGGDGVRALDHDHIGEVLQGPRGLLGLVGGVEGRAVGVGAPELDHAHRAGLTRPPPRIARHRDGRARRAVVAAVHRQHLVARRCGDGPCGWRSQWPPRRRW